MTDEPPAGDRLIILGEAPGNYARPLVLYPYPPNCTGHRLMKLMGMTRFEYLHTDRRNLFPAYPGKSGKGAAFPYSQAKMLARQIEPSLAGYNVLFVGKRVAAAFGFGHNNPTFRKPLQWHPWVYRYAVLPHPSGINRWWNDPDNKAMGEAFLHAVADQWRASAQHYR